MDDSQTTKLRQAASLPAQGGSEFTDLAQSTERVLVRMDDCLAELDVLGWSLAAAHLSHSIEWVRHGLTSLQVAADTGVDCASD